MKTDIFVDAVESSTRLFGRKDVNVVFTGDGAKTDGNTVYLPSMPSGADINARQAAVVRGYRNHEAMHVRITDTSAASMARLASIQSDSLLHGLTQYAEDVRIEHAGVLEYPGMRDDLAAVNTAAANELMKAVESGGGVAAVAASIDLEAAYRIAASRAGRELIGVGDESVVQPLIDELRKRDPVLMEMADKAGKRMASLPTGFSKGRLVETTARKGTKAAFDLAEELAAEVRTYLAQQQPPQPQPQPPQPPDDQGGQPNTPHGDSSGGSGSGSGGQSGGSGDDDEDTDADTDTDDGDDDDSDDGDDQDEDGDDGDGDSDGSDGGGDQGGGHSSGSDPSDDHDSGSAGQSGTGGNSSGNSGSATDVTASIMDAANNGYQQALQSTVQSIQSDAAAKGRLRFRIWSRKFVHRADNVESVVRATLAGNLNYDVRRINYFIDQSSGISFNGMANAISGKKAMIRRVLELELQARSDRHWTSGHSHGRLQSVRLVSAMQGAERVYQRREDGKDMDTVLRISIDGSGSMRGQRSYQSCLLALALVEALERTGCDIEITAWSAGRLANCGSYTRKEYEDANDALSQANRHGGGFHSIGSLNTVYIKTIRQRFSDKTFQRNLALFAGTTLAGTTPTIQSALDDVTQMSRHKHAKKILLHITDGEPDGLACLPDGITETKAVRMMMQGIEEDAARAGIHLIGVGIAGQDASHIYSDHLNVPGADAYEPVIRKLAKLIAREAGHVQRAA